MIRLALALALVTAPALAAPVIDNDSVMIADVPLAVSQSAPPTPAQFDTVTIFLEGGVIATAAKGKTTTATRKWGDAVFTPRGTGAVDTLVSGGPAHEVVIALKDHPASHLPAIPGTPSAFPRPNAVKAFENDRVVVWNFSWTPGQTVPMHQHDKDVVMAFRYDGPIQSTESDGKVNMLPFKKGQITFSKAGRVHAELLAGERQSGIMVELK
jgi:quercetin dioxygenase-like cupin family protein